MKQWLEKQFKLSEFHSNVRTELLAGLTTFVTMAYEGRLGNKKLLGGFRHILMFGNTKHIVQFVDIHRFLLTSSQRMAGIPDGTARYRVLCRIWFLGALFHFGIEFIVKMN